MLENKVHDKSKTDKLNQLSKWYRHHWERRRDQPWTSRLSFRRHSSSLCLNFKFASLESQVLIRIKQHRSLGRELLQPVDTKEAGALPCLYVPTKLQV
jgi:hypothetical protein